MQKNTSIAFKENKLSKNKTTHLKPELNDFKLPMIVTKDSDYIKSLKKKLNEYQNQILDTIGMDKPLYDETKSNISDILKAINHYYNGNIPLAQQHILNILKKYKNNRYIISILDDSPAIRGITRFISLHDATPENNNIKENEYSFFKARVGNGIYTKDDFLHIPFNKREIISTQRFSLPGVPCMYFGTTSYVCWLELGKPADNEFNVCSYQIPKETRILNLSLPQMLINGMSNIEGAHHTVRSFIGIFPLIIATSYHVKDPNRIFKSEYIISQLIMQCLDTLQIEGVAYISKRVKNDYTNGFCCINLAIPMKNSKQNYSNFAKYIPYTNPINLGEYKKLLESDKNKENETKRNKVSFCSSIKATVDYMNKQRPYDGLEFCKFDDFLINEEHKPIEKFNSTNKN